jgi:hypothetical protein
VALRGKKASSRKQVAIWQQWEKSALDRNFRIIAIVLALIALASIATIAVISSRFFIHPAGKPRPVVVNSRPPELLQPVICDLKAGVQTGEVRMSIRNAGNARADYILPAFTAQLVPERHVGIEAFDQVLKLTCKDRPLRAPIADSLDTGQEVNPRMPKPVVTMPPLLQGETAQLYGYSCIYYSDISGTNHATCDTYRFKPASGNPVFVCDGTPKTGTFDGPLTNCGN